MTRLYPIPRPDEIDFVLVPLTNAVFEHSLFRDEPHLLANALGVFANLSREDHSSEGRVAAVMAAATPEMLTSFLEKVHGVGPLGILIPAIQTLGHFFTGTEEQCPVVLDTSLLQNALPIMNHSDWTLQKEICRLLSNVCAGTEEQITHIFICHLDEPLIQLALSAHWEVREEALGPFAIFASGAAR